MPTIVLCTDPFLNSAHRHASVFGRRGFQPLGIPHPLGGITPEAVSERAAGLNQHIIDALTSGE
ncbi:MAG: hypothetical protein FI717_10770 [SAR202 cluster bacterium]|nr:hypothetical protein [SAR202 cluster bacterium]MQG34773.1 hypothetical protein [SAR202 cluster bacterium]